MARPRAPGEKELFWVSSAYRDLLGFPEWVKDRIGTALGTAQFGGKHPAAKPWKGEGPGLVEIVEHHAGDTYRAVYTVRFEKAVYVLHAFQKKSPKGIKTARTDVEPVHRRLQAAREHYLSNFEESWYVRGAEMKAKGKHDLRIRASSGNVFADLNLENAEEKQTKLKLAVALNRVLDRAGLSQAEAAKRLSVNQPKISALRNYKLEGFSVERLIGFVTALSCDVDIVIRDKARSSRPGRVSVRAA
jgi:phage-related protein/predicted XRE-type DNA-binding protein